MFFEERTSVGREINRRTAEYQNTSREAVVTLAVTSAGVGRTRHEAALTFPAPFISEPFMVQGSGVINNPSPSQYHDPEGSAGVWQWLRNEKGLYVGALIWTSVVFEAKVDGAPDLTRLVKVQHWLQFSGTAIKDFGREALDAALTIDPRRVRF